MASDQQLNALLDAVHQAACKSQLFDNDHIKVRAYPVAYYRVAGGDGIFIHAQLRIKSARSTAQKKQLSCLVLEAIKAQPLPSAVITVEVIDMDSESYAKVIT